MAVHSLLTAVLPHRIAGGIGLLLIGMGIASVRHYSYRAPSITTASMTPIAGSSQSLSQQVSSEIGGNNDMEGTYRGFSLATDPLPAFRITNLSTPLRAKEQLDVLAMAQNGEILGTITPLHDNPALPGSKRPAPKTYAAYWKNGKLYRLPIPRDAYRVVAGDINDRGDIAVVGIRYRRGKPSFNRIFLYRRGATYQDLGTLDPHYAQMDTANSAKMRGVSENLLCLNNQGTILALVGSKSWFRRADGMSATLGDGIAFDLNNNDTAVGFIGAYTSGAAMWRNVATDASATVPLLPMQKLGKEGGQSYWRGSAECVNDKNETVLSVPIDSSNGFRRVGRTAYYLLRDNKLQLIAQMRGYQRARTRINTFGDVIGFTDTDTQAQTISPLLYRDRKMYDLTNVVRGSGWKIVSTVDIDNKRRILVYGVHKDNENAVVPLLLTPVEKPL